MHTDSDIVDIIFWLFIWIEKLLHKTLRTFYFNSKFYYLKVIIVPKELKKTYKSANISISDDINFDDLDKS